MKVKVGNKIIDGENEPIMIILTDQDKANIKNMAPCATKYCMFPDGTDIEFIQAWMKTE